MGHDDLRPARRVTQPEMVEWRERMGAAWAGTSIATKGLAWSSPFDGDCASSRTMATRCCWTTAPRSTWKSAP